MKYIAELNNECGIGNSLKEAFDELRNNSTQNEILEYEVQFFEANEIFVKFDITKIEQSN